jgi:hypothetical protein
MFDNRMAQGSAALVFVRDQAAAGGDLALQARAADMASYFAPEAEAGERAALALAEASGDRDAIAFVEMRLASVLAREGKPGAAALFEDVVSSIDLLDDPRIALKALHNMSQFAFNNGDMHEAMARADEAAANAKRFRYGTGEAMANWTRALVLSALSQDTLAIERFSEAVAGFRAAGSPEHAAEVLADEAHAELRAGRLEQGSAHLREAVAAARSDRPWLGPAIVSPVDSLLPPAGSPTPRASRRRPGRSGPPGSHPTRRSCWRRRRCGSPKESRRKPWRR